MRNDDVIPKWGHLRLRGGGEGRQILQGLPRIMDGGMLFLVVNLGVNQVHGFFGHFFWPVLGGLKIGRAQKKNAEEELENRKVALKSTIMQLTWCRNVVDFYRGPCD